MNGWSVVLLFIAVGLLGWNLGRRTARSSGRTPVVVARLCAAVGLVWGLFLLGSAAWSMLRHRIDWPHSYLRIISGVGFVGLGILFLKRPVKGSVNDRQSQDH